MHRTWSIQVAHLSRIDLDLDLPFTLSTCKDSLDLGPVLNKNICSKYINFIYSEWTFDAKNMHISPKF